MAKGSLTIREGVSHLKVILIKRSKFPHYTWGCIRTVHILSSRIFVPSLYVRVYRDYENDSSQRKSSLTIREGVSCFILSNSLMPLFPHYTWGCIEKTRFQGFILLVPSLYVRVYRGFITGWRRMDGSLTIREGVSKLRNNLKYINQFPHYTWGCIAAGILWRRSPGVPSLYVRVYRYVYLDLVACHTFPHYTWGCIANVMLSDYDFPVPSLRMRVC